MNTIYGQEIRVVEDVVNRSYDKYDTDPTPKDQELEQLTQMTTHGKRLHFCVL